MNGSFLRASLFTSVLSYGVCLFAIGVGLTLIILGWALNKVSSQTVPVVAGNGGTRARPRHCLTRTRRGHRISPVPPSACRGVPVRVAR